MSWPSGPVILSLAILALAAIWRATVLGRRRSTTLSKALEAEGGIVTLVVEEGRFLKITAGAGWLNSLRGQLLPVDGSLGG